MPHVSVIPLDADILSHFTLRPCDGCEFGCTGKYNHVHCPLCPTSKFKPNRKAKVEQHLLCHYQGKVGFVETCGFIISACSQACDQERNAKVHYHCPYCIKSYTKKQALVAHSQKCQPREGAPDTNTDTAAETTAHAQREEEPETATQDLHATSSYQHNDSLETQDGGTTASDAQDGTSDISDASTVRCPVCDRKYHRKYLSVHLRRHDASQPPRGIDEQRHHFVACVDPGRGIYSYPHNRPRGYRMKIFLLDQQCQLPLDLRLHLQMGPKHPHPL